MSEKRYHTKAELIAAARRYAAADASNPHALKTAMAFLERNKFKVEYNGNGDPTHYDATEDTETRYLPDGTSYQATVYKNIVRP